MTFPVFLTDDASRDLEAFYDDIDSRDAPGKAHYVLDQIEEAFSNLRKNPERGTYPKELLAVGLREYREVFFKPYRIIYRVMDDKVYVMVIADGRRDTQALLPTAIVASLNLPAWVPHGHLTVEIRPTSLYASPPNGSAVQISSGCKLIFETVKDGGTIYPAYSRELPPRGDDRPPAFNGSSEMKC